MKIFSFVVLSLSFMLAASSSFAIAGTTVPTDTSLNEHVYDLYVGGGSHDHIDYTMNANMSSVVIDGTEIKVGVTAWSDTANISSSYDDDKVVKYSQLNAYGDGFGLVNNNHNDSHTLDNFTGGDDFDMVLFSFSEAVTLTGANYTYLQGYDTGKQVTVVGLNDISLFQNHASNGFTWADVASGVGTVISDGHFNISSNISHGGAHGNFSSDFTGLSAAKYWLVGAYNIYFDDSTTSFQGSGFKLASLNLTSSGPDIVQPPTQVSAPSSAMWSLVLVSLLLWRRDKQTK
ncbi:hypothetical protein D210916BOD24_09580 [Alteromonas sp. D210916BOD_24]|uniref:exosortase-dependent surface protein XDP1 n=1 Tax=Alteromonas sp. D210916BOD_24 TaxID=3157618 RepID=UPI00399D417A